MRKYYSYAITYFLVFLPVTNWLPIRRELYLATFCLAAILFIKKGVTIKKSYGKVFLLISIVLILQTIAFAKLGIDAVIGLYIAITLPYLAVIIIGKDYCKVFINIVYCIVLTSFLFYIPSLLYPSAREFIQGIAFSLGTDVWLRDQNFLIYTARYSATTSFGLLRNSGNFNEPGYFACYIAMALSLNLLYKGRLLDIKNIVFILGILSTFSTAGYIALYFVLSYYSIFIYKNKMKYLLVPLFIVLSFYTYSMMDFMQPKIQQHYTSQIEDGVRAGRFGATLADLEDIKMYPLTGRGIISTTRYDEIESWEGDEAPWQSLNGITNLMVRLGLIGFTIYLIWLFKSVQHFVLNMKFPAYSTYLILGTMFIVLSAQNLAMTVFFWSLLYLKSIKYEKE